MKSDTQGSSSMVISLRDLVSSQSLFEPQQFLLAAKLRHAHLGSFSRAWIPKDLDFSKHWGRVQKNVSFSRQGPLLAQHHNKRFNNKRPIGLINHEVLLLFVFSAW